MVCRGARKTTRRYPRRFAEEFAASGLEYALSNRISSGIWGGLTERECRPLQSRLVQEARRERDRAIVVADAAGYTTAAIARSFGLSQISVTRIARGGTDAGWSVRTQYTAEEDDGRAAS